MARFLRSLLAGVALLAVTVIPAHAAVPTEVKELRERVERTDAALDEAGQQQVQLTEQVAAARLALEDADVAVAAAEGSLAGVEAQLEHAEALLEGAEQSLSDASAEVGRAVRRLIRAQERLDQTTAALHRQIGAAYRHAGGDPYMTAAMDALAGHRSLTDYLTAIERLEIGAGRQRDVVLDVERAMAQVEASAAEVEKHRVARADEHKRAVAATAAVQALVDEQAAALAALEEVQQGREALVEQLEADADAAEELTRQLAAESDALREELGRYAGTAGAPGAGGLLWPTDGHMTSGFGPRYHPIHKTRRMHEGIDIPAPTGQPVIAAADGVVVGAGRRGGYGLAVIVDHGGGITTLSGHLSRIDVNAGQTVKAGEVIGAVGSTGQSTGPHLHFEIRRDGRPVDPAAWF